MVAALMLAVPVAGATDWPQTGSDAARTGALTGAGPAWNDTAFSLDLPGAVTTPASWGNIGPPAEPLIWDGHAFISVEPAQNGSGKVGIARVDLGAGEAELFIPLEEPPRHLAIAQEKLLVATGDRVSAYALATGEERWTWAMEQDPQRTPGCFTLTARANTVVAGCMRMEGASLGGAENPAPVIQTLEIPSGEPVWKRPLDSRQWSNQTSQADPLEGGGQASLADTPGRWVTGVSLIGDRVYVATLQSGWMGLCEVRDPEGEIASACWSHRDNTLTVWALDGQTGEIDWSNTTEPIEQRRIAIRDVGEPQAGEGERFASFSPRVTGTARTLYMKWDGTLRKLNAGQEGDVIWQADLGQEDAVDTQADCTTSSCPAAFGGTGSALHEQVLYASSTQSLYRLDVEDHKIDWQVPVDFEERVSWGSLILAGGRLYAMADGPGYGVIYALDDQTGQELWRQELVWRSQAPDRQFGDRQTFTDNRSHRYGYAMGEGLLVAAGTDGSVHVIGRTNASLTPIPQLSTATPGVGEPVTVDLSETDPGAFGPATRFRADWGDGNVTGWTENTTITHTYEEEGPHEARIWVANDENQTASTVRTFDVGATEPNWVAERFEPENQEMTFGVLGIAMALGGGAIGVARRHRKRSNLEDELEALERGFEETKEQPSECEAFLDTRKARARSLALDGYLREDQVPVIENRAEELRGKLRTSALEEEFAFLPYGLVTKARQMVQDGDVTALEKDAFLRALEEDEVLTSEQKATVRGRIERWHGRDAGGST